MGLNLNERFENHMDSSRLETIGDAHRIESVSDDIYDDLFEERLSHASEYAEPESAIDDMEDDDKNSDDLKSKEYKQSSVDIVFEGIAEENPQYGEGGGKQYFIRDFGDMKQDGRMNKVGEERLEYTGSLVEDAGKLTDIEKQEYKYNYSVDTSPLSDEEKADWAQLDKATRDEQGLSRVMPDIKSQILEDRKNPWSDQENSGGSFFPDAYSNPRELQSGETYYQLRPVDTKYDSPYVTDKKTVETCRGENGEVDVLKLLQKLQVKQSNVREYILTQYRYEPGEKSNKDIK